MHIIEVVMIQLTQESYGDILKCCDGKDLKLIKIQDNDGRLEFIVEQTYKGETLQYTFLAFPFEII